MNHYWELFDMQGGLCAICAGMEGRDLVVDHDHETGYIRGLLCRSCNTWEGVGYAPELLSYRLNHPAVGRGWIYCSTLAA